MTDPVGQTEIAQRAGVVLGTVDAWIRRHPDFPQPRWTVGGRAAWDWPDVQAWLVATRRRAEDAEDVAAARDETVRPD